MPGIVEWHCRGVLGDGSDDGLSGPSGAISQCRAGPGSGPRAARCAAGPGRPVSGCGFGKPLGGFGEGLPEAPDDGAVLGRARFGEAVRVRLPAVVGHDLVRMRVPVRCGTDAHGVFDIEVPGAFAADDRVPTSPPARPAHVPRWRCRGPSPPRRRSGHHPGRPNRGGDTRDRATTFAGAARHRDRDLEDRSLIDALRRRASANAEPVRIRAGHPNPRKVGQRPFRTGRAPGPSTARTGPPATSAGSPIFGRFGRVEAARQRACQTPGARGRLSGHMRPPAARRASPYGPAPSPASPPPPR